MNISIGTSKKKSSKTSFKSGAAKKKKKKAAKKPNVFGDDSDDGGGDDDGDKNKNKKNSSDDDDDDDAGINRAGLTGRDRVNRQILAEQDALRQRAQAAMSNISQKEASIYDYDDAYDSFAKREDAKKDDGDDAGDKKSRYIGSLLKTAKKRQHERELIHERKVAREQEDEEANADFRGKDKFVTKAYKRKLEERKRWQEEEEQQLKEEEANDVSKKSAGAAFGSFYGNFSKNVSMGGADAKVDEKGSDDDNKDEKDAKKAKTGLGGAADDDFDFKSGFLSGFETSAKADDGKDGAAGAEEQDRPSPSKPAAKPANQTTQKPRFSKRQIREMKVAAARKRYLQRRQTAQLQ